MAEKDIPCTNQSIDSRDVTDTVAVTTLLRHSGKRTRPNSSVHIEKKSKPSNEISSRSMKGKSILEQDCLPKNLSSFWHDEAKTSRVQVVSNKNTSNLLQPLCKKEKHKKPEFCKKTTRARAISTDVRLSSTSPPVLGNSTTKKSKVKQTSLRHSWHGIPSGYKSRHRHASERWKDLKLSQTKGVGKILHENAFKDEDISSEDEDQIVNVFPHEARRLFNGLKNWLEMAVHRLEWMEQELNEAQKSKDEKVIERVKKTFQVFKEESRVQEFKLTMIKQTCDTAIGIHGEEYCIAVRKWEVIKKKVTIHEQKLTLVSQGEGNLSHLYYWLNEAEALLESYTRLKDNEGISSLKDAMARHEEYFKILENKRRVINELCASAKDGDLSIDEGILWDLSQRFKAIERGSRAAADWLNLAYYKNKVEQCIELCKEQLLDDRIKFTSPLQAEETFQDHLKFFHDEKYIKKLSSYCKRLKDAVEKYRPIMSEEEQRDVDVFLGTVSNEFEDILRRMKKDEQKLENIHYYWTEYEHAVQLSLPWLNEAERLLKEGKVKQCKDYFMDFEDAQQDVIKATEAVKILKRYFCGTLNVTMQQQVSNLDRLLRKITRRYTRLVKSEHRSPKLEKYECCVDEIMDWLDQSEMAVNDDVKIGGLERVEQQVCTFEMLLNELNDHRSGVETVNEIGKSLMNDKNIASSVKANISNVNRRFEKLKTTLPQKHKKLKQLQRLVQTLNSGLEQESKWCETTCKLLEEELCFASFDEIKALYLQYETQMASYKKHEDRMKATNNACLQIRAVLNDKEIYKEKFEEINQKWKFVQEHAEAQHSHIRHVFITWEKFENSFIRLKDVSYSIDEDEKSFKEGENLCEEIGNCQKELCSIIENEVAVKSLVEKAVSAREEWRRLIVNRKTRKLEEEMNGIRDEVLNEFQTVYRDLVIQLGNMDKGVDLESVIKSTLSTVGCEAKIEEFDVYVNQLSENEAKNEISECCDVMKTKWRTIKEELLEEDAKYSKLKEDLVGYNVKEKELDGWVQKVEDICECLEAVEDNGNSEELFKTFDSICEQTENKTRLLEELTRHKDHILASVEIRMLEDRYQILNERALMAKNKFEATRRQLPELKRYLVHQKTSKGLLQWLTETNSVFKECVSIDTLERAKDEIEAHYRTKAALVDATQAIEETISNAKALGETSSLSEADTEGCALEELWTSTQTSLSKRTRELEECVALWTFYEENMLQVMSCLTKGELVLTEVKSIEKNTKDALQNSLHQTEAEKSKLDKTFEVLNNMKVTAEKLGQTAGSSGAAAMETKLNDTTRLCNFLREEMLTYSELLKDRIEKWDHLHTCVEDLTSWMKNTEQRLQGLQKNEKLNGDWLNYVKEISAEVLNRRESIETLTENVYELLDGCLDVSSIETKKQLIDLRRRWDALYEATMEYEVKTELGLKPLREFEVACDEFEIWLSKVEGRCRMVRVCSTQELMEQINECQIVAADLARRARDLEELIWQGSQISASGKLFSHSELKARLKILDQRWKANQSQVRQRLHALKSVQGKFTEKETRFLDVFNQLERICQRLHEEQTLKERTKSILETFAKSYEDVERDLNKLRALFEPTVNEFEELGQQYDIIDMEKLHESCNDLKSKWRETKAVVPQRVAIVQEEINTWVEFNEKFTEIQSWLDEVKKLCKQWRNEKNSADLIQNLEELQTGFRKRQEDFEILVEESRQLREVVSDEADLEKLNIAYLTESWDECSRWASGRYQLAILSKHYEKSSSAVVKYLDKIQSKMSTVELPNSVAQKINGECQKAKVLVKDWNDKCQDLDVILKDGHLMLQGKFCGQSLAFEEELKSLDNKWNQVYAKVETQKREVEVTARKWWDFTRNKVKMMRWLNRKEYDAGLGEPLAAIMEDPQEQLNNYEEILERIIVRKSDLQTLNETAFSILESDHDDDLSEFVETINERFKNLEAEVSRKRDFFCDLVKRWNDFSNRKKKISELFRSASYLVAKKQIRSTSEVREQLEQCQMAVVQLEQNETDIMEISEEGGKLVAELRNEGMNVDRMEHEIHTVMNRYNEMKNRAVKKEQVLQSVSDEMEKLDEGKVELESWLTNVHQQLDSVDKDDTLSRAIQHQFLARRSLIRSVSAQMIKLQATEEADVDLNAILQPLHTQWRSLQNLANLPNSSFVDSEQNLNSSLLSCSQNDLGSLDTFSEGLGLSRDDVTESDVDITECHDAMWALDNWINKLSEFRECLHRHVYCPEDELFEVEQKLNIVQKNLKKDLFCFVYEFNQERIVLQNSSDDEDDNVASLNKIHEIDSLLDSILNELGRIEEELQTIYDLHLDYNSAVNDWLVWFGEAKKRLNSCQVKDGKTIDEKNNLIQAFLDEMDQVDLISEVYTKGETLLQIVSDPVKSRVENQLAVLENDWAVFCKNVTECSNDIKEELLRLKDSNASKEFEDNFEAVTEEDFEESKINLCKNVTEGKPILKQNDEFNNEASELLDWIKSTKITLGVDFYSLTEEDRQLAAFKQETLAKEFNAKKFILDKLLKNGNLLKSQVNEDCKFEIKLTALSGEWRELECAFANQEQHINECFKEHQTYFDAVEELWDWMRDIGKRLSIQMDKSESTNEQELCEYSIMLSEIKSKIVLFDEVLKSGEKLSMRLVDEEKSEIEEQLERFKSEWEILKSQVVERLKELQEVMGENVLAFDIETLEQLTEEHNDPGLSLTSKVLVGETDFDEDFSTELSSVECGLGNRLSSEITTEENGLNCSESKADSVCSERSFPFDSAAEVLTDEIELDTSLPSELLAEESMNNLNNGLISFSEHKTDLVNGFSSEVLAAETTLNLNVNKPDLALNERSFSANNVDASEELLAKGTEFITSLSNKTLGGERTNMNRSDINSSTKLSTIDVETIQKSQDVVYPENAVKLEQENEGKMRSKLEIGNSIRTEQSFEETMQNEPCSFQENVPNEEDFESCVQNTREIQTSVQNVQKIEKNLPFETDPKRESLKESTTVFQCLSEEILPKETTNQTELFMKRVNDIKAFLSLIESKVSELNSKESSEMIVQDLLTKFSSRGQEFEAVLDSGMALARNISEDEQFKVEEIILTLEDKWNSLKEGLLKRKTAMETVFVLERELGQFEKFAEEISSFVASKDENKEWLFDNGEAGCVMDCYLSRLEREQVALKGLIEGSKDRLACIQEEARQRITEMSTRVSENQSKLAQSLVEKKAMLKRWFEFSLILENVEREVEALTVEFGDLVDEENIVMKCGHLSESRIYMFKILLGSLERKKQKLSELSVEYNDILSLNGEYEKKFQKHERNISENVTQVEKKLEKLQKHLTSFQILDVEANELQDEVSQADEAAATFHDSVSKFDKVDDALTHLSKIKILEENILGLEPRVQLVKEKSVESLNTLDYENSGYWFQESVQCLISSYEKARVQVRKNVESIESSVSIQSTIELKFQEILVVLENVEGYIDEENSRNFDVTAKEVALVNGKRFLNEMELKDGCLAKLIKMGKNLGEQENDYTWSEKVDQLNKRFNVRFKELRRNVSCLDETLQCYNDFEVKVEELSLLMIEAQGFLYGQGVKTRTLEDLLELGRECLESVKQKEVTLMELKNRVELLTESSSEEENEIIVAELVNLELKVSALKETVVGRISFLEKLGSRRDLFKDEMNKLRTGISSLKQECENSVQAQKLSEEPDCAPEDRFSEKLKMFRSKIQDLNEIKSELEEGSQAIKVDLGNLLALEPLELTVTDLEKIDKEKTSQLREYETLQRHIFRKVCAFEEQFDLLKREYKQNEVSSFIFAEFVEKADCLLEEVGKNNVGSNSVGMLSDERAGLINRLETIRNDCIQMQGYFGRVAKKETEFTEEYHSEGHNVSVQGDSIVEMNRVDDAVVEETISLQFAAMQSVKERLVDTQCFAGDFQVLQSKMESLANDEEVLEIIISNTQMTSGDLDAELRNAKAKLQSLEQKEKQLQIVYSQAQTMGDVIPSQQREIYEESVSDIKEKFATAKECLLTRIGMLEQCLQARTILQKNLEECYETLNRIDESEIMDAVLVDEFIDKLRDPNNCLENATRLCFALSVVGDFEETERIQMRLSGLRERWDKTLRLLEQRSNEVVNIDIENKSNDEENVIQGEFIIEEDNSIIQQQPVNLATTVNDVAKDDNQRAVSQGSAMERNIAQNDEEGTMNVYEFDLKENNFVTQHEAADVLQNIDIEADSQREVGHGLDTKNTSDEKNVLLSLRENLVTQELSDERPDVSDGVVVRVESREEINEGLVIRKDIDEENMVQLELTSEEETVETQKQCIEKAAIYNVKDVNKQAVHQDSAMEGYTTLDDDEDGTINLPKLPFKKNYFVIHTQALDEANMLDNVVLEVNSRKETKVMQENNDKENIFQFELCTKEDGAEIQLQSNVTKDENLKEVFQDSAVESKTTENNDENYLIISPEFVLKENNCISQNGSEHVLPTVVNKFDNQREVSQDLVLQNYGDVEVTMEKSCSEIAKESPELAVVFSSIGEDDYQKAVGQISTMEQNTAQNDGEGTVILLPDFDLEKNNSVTQLQKVAIVQNTVNEAESQREVSQDVEDIKDNSNDEKNILRPSGNDLVTQIFSSKRANDVDDVFVIVDGQEEITEDLVMKPNGDEENIIQLELTLEEEETETQKNSNEKAAIFNNGAVKSDNKEAMCSDSAVRRSTPLNDGKEEPIVLPKCTLEKNNFVTPTHVPEVGKILDNIACEVDSQDELNKDLVVTENGDEDNLFQHQLTTEEEDSEIQLQRIEKAAILDDVVVKYGNVEEVSQDLVIKKRITLQNVDEENAFLSESIPATDNSVPQTLATDEGEIATNVVFEKTLETAKERLLEISESEEMLSKLSFEVSEFEKQMLAWQKDFQENQNIEGTLQDEIEKARDRLQNISAELRTAFPELKNYPAYSPENELYQRNEYLKNELEQFLERIMTRVRHFKMRQELQGGNWQREVDFENRVNILATKIAELEVKLSCELGKMDSELFKAFNEQFALISDEIDELSEEASVKANEDSEGQLSAKLQDVRSRFIRIQELVEQQKELNERERFEKAVQVYKKKFDAFSATFQYDGSTEQEEQFASLDKNFKLLEELGFKIITSVSEEEKNNTNLLLNELRTSLEKLKLRTCGNEHVLLGKTKDAGGDVCSKTTDSDTATMVMRLSDDSDVDCEEQRFSKGSSDGSQYGSDSGMGDSLMNTLASEYTDGCSKTPTVSPQSNKTLARDEAIDTRDTLCAKAPVRCETDKRIAADNISRMKVDGRRVYGLKDGQVLNHTSQADGDMIFYEHGKEIAVDGISQTKSVCSRECEKNDEERRQVLNRVGPVENGIFYEKNVIPSGESASRESIDENAREENVLSNNMLRTSTSHENDEGTMDRGLSLIDVHLQFVNVDKESEAGSLEYLSSPEQIHASGSLPKDILLNNLELKTIHPENSEQSSKQLDIQPHTNIFPNEGTWRDHENTELKDQTNSGPILPPEYLLPEYSTSDIEHRGKMTPEYPPSEETLQNDSFSDTTILENLPSKLQPWKLTSSEDGPQEIKFSECRPSELLPSEFSPQGSYLSQDHDEDEELLLRSSTLQNNDTDERFESGKSVEESPFASHAPPPMMTVEDFFQEPEVMFHRLVDIEVMLRPQGKDEDNLKSALLKHVALCVEMKSIQSKMNVINRHGRYFMKNARSGLREILEERLKALNNQWDKLQDHASARQKDLEQLLQDSADNELSGEDSSLNALRNNTALLSSLYFNTENEDIKRLLNKLGLFSNENDEAEDESRRKYNDDYLDYQSAFHDLFEWLTVAEENIQSVSTSESEVAEIKQRLKQIQDLCQDIQRKKPLLNELVDRSKKYTTAPGQETADEIRHLWRDVMLKACTKIRELLEVLQVVIIKELNVDKEEEFSKLLSDCEIGVKNMLERLQESCPAITRDDSEISVALYQAFSSEAELLTKVLDILKTSSHFAQNSSAVNKLLTEITDVAMQLNSWQKQLREKNAIEMPDPVQIKSTIVQVTAELKSPRSRPRTWPGHIHLPTQVMEEIKKFEEWLKSAEENLQKFIGITIPQTLSEMKAKLKEVQLVARNVESKITEMEYTLNSLEISKDEPEYAELTEKCQNCLSRAKNLKAHSDVHTKELKEIRCHWELFESRFAEMLRWLEKTRVNLILPLKERSEDSVEILLGKLLKIRELEKKMSEKVTVKDDVLRQGEHVLARSEAAEVNVKIEQLREEWVGIENELGRERLRLDKMMRLWKEYERKQEEMYEWLTGILSSLRALECEEKNIDAIKNQISLVRKHHDEIEKHLTLKESADSSFHFLIDNIQGDIEGLKLKQQQLNSHWQELQSLVSDRFDELVAVEWELEMTHMTASVQELNNCVKTAKELELVRVPPIGSSSLDEIKSLVTKYQKAKREFRSKQEKLDELKRKSRNENMKEEKCIALGHSIAQLDEEWKQVTLSLSEKEESLKISLNNWIDFQRQLTDLVDTDSWFATREAAMSKYQHISTEKDRTVALEDVKAMKGFLVTQKTSVTSFVDSARGLLAADGVYDSEEIEGILGDIEERWLDINTKVNDCEEWLNEMSTKHKSCRDSIGLTMAFLEEAELVLQSFASFDGDLNNLAVQKNKLCNLEAELNDLRSTVYDLNSILVELNNVCDESIIYELEKDIQDLNQRYGNVSDKITSRRVQTELLLKDCQDFDKDCTEIFAWLEYQSEVLEQDKEQSELATELAQLKDCEQLQRDFDKQQEHLEGVKNRGQELKSKMKQGKIFVSPKLAKLTQTCSEFALALNEKQKTLKERTSSWLEFCHKLQSLDERVEESENLVYTTRYNDTKEYYRLLQKLVRETIQMRPELEELREFTEENFMDKNTEQGRNAANEVEDIRQRLEILSAELNSKKTEAETVQKLQAKFQEQCRHLNAVLQDAEMKLTNEEDFEHLHDQEQSFEFFQSNSERYKEELLCAQRLAESIDQNTSVDANTRAEIEEKLNVLKQRWENTYHAVWKQRQNVDNRLGKWRDFKRKHKAFVSWLSDFESRPGLQPVASSDITELESQVKYVEACREELAGHKNEFDLLHATTAQCLNTSNDTVTDAVKKEYMDAEHRWLRVSDCLASNQRTLELTLCDWQEYTTVMEDTMHWLRQTELYLKTCSAATLSDVKKYYDKLKELSREVEERRPHLELLTQRGKRLSRMSSYTNADHINNQVSIMGTLWTNVCSFLSSKMHITIDSLHRLRRFMDNFESLSAWLHRLEDIVHRDRQHFYSCSPKEQRAKIKAYRKEIEGRESQRSSINDATLQLIDMELGNELLRHVMEQRDALNERWETLCIQLGISYKKAEQTKYSLKLLEAQLTQLNKWMVSVERQITQFSEEISCDSDELSQQLVNLQISQKEINTRSPDVISVLSLCVRLQSCAFPDENGSKDLQFARDTFESRWKNISKNVVQLSKQNRDRIALCKEVQDDYKQFMTWLKMFESHLTLPSRHCEDLHELSLEIARLQDLKRQLGAKGVLFERLLTRGHCLVNGSTSSSANVMLQMIAKVKERWYSLTKELDDSIRRFHLLSKDFMEFEDERRNVNAWLTNIEVRLIGLEELGNEQQNEEQRLQDLKTLQRDINMKYGSLSDLTSLVGKLKGFCSISDYRLQQQKVEELKLRYEQALHYSLTLMLDLAVPSPFSSPDRVVGTRLNFSKV